MADVAGTTGDQHILHSERTPFLELGDFSGRGCVVDGPRKSPCSAADFGSLLHIFWGHVSCFCEVAMRPSSGRSTPDRISAASRFYWRINSLVRARSLGRASFGMHAPARSAPNGM